jgi:hypothetical protein
VSHKALVWLSASDATRDHELVTSSARGITDGRAPTTAAPRGRTGRAGGSLASRRARRLAGNEVWRKRSWTPLRRSATCWQQQVHDARASGAAAVVLCRWAPLGDDEVLDDVDDADDLAESVTKARVSGSMSLRPRRPAAWPLAWRRRRDTRRDTNHGQPKWEERPTGDRREAIAAGSGPVQCRRPALQGGG